MKVTIKYKNKTQITDNQLFNLKFNVMKNLINLSKVKSNSCFTVNNGKTINNYCLFQISIIIEDNNEIKKVKKYYIKRSVFSINGIVPRYTIDGYLAHNHSISTEIIIHYKYSTYFSNEKIERFKNYTEDQKFENALKRIMKEMKDHEYTIENLL